MYYLMCLLIIFPLYKIFQKAGLDKRLSFLIFIPFIGILVSSGILAASEWKLDKKIK